MLSLYLVVFKIINWFPSLPSKVMDSFYFLNSGHMDVYIFDVLQSIAIIILTDIRMAPVLVGGNFFK